MSQKYMIRKALNQRKHCYGNTSPVSIMTRQQYKQSLPSLSFTQW